jgi:hypothetical protein
MLGMATFSDVLAVITTTRLRTSTPRIHQRRSWAAWSDVGRPAGSGRTGSRFADIRVLGIGGGQVA